MKYSVNLPFPPSTNRLWRTSYNRVHISTEYARWKRTADGMFYEQFSNKRPQRIEFLFTIHIVLGRQFRGGSNGRAGYTDGDNRTKAVLDWCQRAGLVKDDKFCEAWPGEWGEAPTGCRITLEALDYPWLKTGTVAPEPP